MFGNQHVQFPARPALPEDALPSSSEAPLLADLLSSSMPGGDRRPQRVDRARAVRESYDQKCNKVETAARTVLSDLRWFGDRVLSACRNRSLPTSIVVEDCSGRFVGLYIGKLFRKHGHDLPIVFVKPPELSQEEAENPDLWPPHFRQSRRNDSLWKLLHPGSLDYAADHAAFRVKLLCKRETLGNAPLVVTEYLDSGRRMSNMVKALAAPEIRLTYATMYFDPRRSLIVNEVLKASIPPGGQVRLLRGCSSTYPRCMSASFSWNGTPKFKSLNNNGLLNGVRSANRSSDFDPDPQMSHQVEPAAHPRRRDYLVDHTVVRHSRAILRALVDSHRELPLTSKMSRHLLEAYHRVAGQLDERLWRLLDKTTESVERRNQR